MKFKKIYIEITNSCNYNCSFCFKTTRPAKFMSIVEFQFIVDKIRPFTNYIYLHVLGEPLLHPQFDKILEIAITAGLNINITTNGGLLAKRGNLLIKHKVRQVNISLHDAEENVEPSKWKEYLCNAFDFATQAASDSYVSLRLWNTSNKGSADFNALCLNEISAKFEIPVDLLQNITRGNGLKLADHIFLQLSPRFEWPDEKNTGDQVQKTCYALRDHIAVLVDGTVVPCCLDADANMALGNLFSSDLVDIINTERALKIKKGFEQHKVVESLCTSCGFMID